jgi:hypothetical protein
MQMLRGQGCVGRGKAAGERVRAAERRPCWQLRINLGSYRWGCRIFCLPTKLLPDPPFSPPQNSTTNNSTTQRGTHPKLYTSLAKV